ncbi:hypothetical protein KBX06_04320 [Micromonospora sp. C31]|uniref:hypothetical protein n=1 Tax=Micromonospora sp. C31 TaxID=2824876 RepID=UPI001B388A74|nr:hypothetical protein [Micromonospora sp. C31]MBQ1072395.1 hypothetical protein [Micromonospora sp. C31]
MDADAADRPESGPDPGGQATRGGAGVDRLRTVVLAVAGLAALIGGGWWWQVEAPRTGPVGAASSAAPRVGNGADGPAAARARAVSPEGPGRSSSFWLVDPGTGEATRTDPRSGLVFRVDPGSGDAVRVDVGPGGRDARRRMEQGLDEVTRHSGLARLPDTVWTARGLLRSTEGLVKRASAEGGARHSLQFRCVGPGELLIVIDGARAADPITSACDGSVTATEVTGQGGLFQVSLSSANAEPLRVEAQLVALP